MLITSVDGGSCGGDVDPSTSIAEKNTVPALLITTQASGIDITSTHALPTGSIHMFDMSGRSVRTHSASSGTRWHMQPPDVPGAFLITFDGDGVELHERFVWMH